MKITSNQREVAKNILMALGVIGVVSVVMVAPGLAKVIPYLSKIKTKRIVQEINRLKKRGLIEIIKHRNGVKEIKLTKEGQKKILKYKIDSLKIEKQDKWDGSWRVVIFDIPIEKNKNRRFLRVKMKQLGFYKLQNSVFVNPYPCYDVVRFIRQYFDVTTEVEYLEVASLESQDKLIAHFFV